MAKASKASIDKCKLALRKVVPEHVSDEFISKVVDRMAELKEREGARGTKGAFRKAVGELAQETRAALAQQRIERAQNILKTKSRLDHYSKFVDPTLSGKRKGLVAAEGLMSKLGGGQQLVQGINDSVSLRGSVLYHDYQSMAYAGIAKKGHWDLFASNAIEKEIMQEMHEIRPGGKPGISGSTEARDIAEVLAGVQRKRWQDMRDSGVNLGKIENRIMPQVWDRVKAKEAGLEAWKSKIAPLLDPERTFGFDAGDNVKMNEFLDAAYKSITEGKFEDGDPNLIQTGDELITTSNYAKLGDTLSRSRALHFKDGASFYEFNKDFGAQSLKQAFHREMRSNAKASALIDTFGTNPEAAVQADKVRIRKMLKGDDEALNAFDARMGAVDNLYGQVTGQVNRAVDPTLARWSNSVRSFNNLVALGGTMLRSLPDVANGIAITSSATGDGLGHTAIKYAGAFIETVPRGQRKQVAELIGLSLKDHFAEIADITGADAVDRMPGLLSKTNATFFKWIGLEDWTETTRLTTPMLLAREGGVHAGTPFAELSPQYRANLERYNIGESEWTALSKTAGKIEDGSTIIRADALHEMNDALKGQTSVVNGQGQNVSPTKFLRDTEVRWRSYLQENAEFSAPAPNERVRARITQGTQAGTLAGEAMRFVGQFKAFPLFGYDLMLRIMSSNPDKPAFFMRDALKGQGDFQRLTGFMVGATLAAYTGDALLSISRNETPPDPRDPWTWKRAFQLSGSAGLYGDVLLGEAQRLQQGGLWNTLLGPTASRVSDVAALSSSMIQHYSSGEDTTKDQLKAFNFMVRQVPGNNIFYMKTALDQMILDRMRNGIDPMYDMNKRSRLEKQGKQQLIDF